MRAYSYLHSHAARPLSVELGLSRRGSVKSQISGVGPDVLGAVAHARRPSADSVVAATATVSVTVVSGTGQLMPLRSRARRLLYSAAAPKRRQRCGSDGGLSRCLLWHWAPGTASFACASAALLGRGAQAPTTEWQTTAAVARSNRVEVTDVEARQLVRR